MTNKHLDDALVTIAAADDVIEQAHALAAYLQANPDVQDAVVNGYAKVEFVPGPISGVATTHKMTDPYKVGDTGGKKGVKSIEFSRLPLEALSIVAEHFHDGSTKYPDVAPGVSNWSLGYPWSASIDALYRHMSSWVQGDSIDPEFDRTHLAAVAFHALVLMTFELNGWGADDRPTPENRAKYLEAK